MPWLENVLRLLLKRRDRDVIIGDLLEEYREVIVPTRGRFRAALWYVQQTLSLVDGVWFGFALGVVLGAWILIDTAISPLAEDTALGVGGMFGGVFVLLGFAGFAARRRGGRVADAGKAGATAGTVTFVLFLLAGIFRVNLFLDAIRKRRLSTLIAASELNASSHSRARFCASAIWARVISLTRLFRSTTTFFCCSPERRLDARLNHWALQSHRTERRQTP